jgi:hypothetical protein
VCIEQPVRLGVVCHERQTSEFCRGKTPHHTVPEGSRKSRAKSRGNTWAFDGDTITVFISMTWKRRGGRKVIIAPDGSDAWAPAKPRPDETLIRALARAHRWKRMLEVERYRSIAEIAEAEKIDRSFVSRLLRLTLLAPDIQEAILEGRQAKGIQLDELTQAVPGAWEEQRLLANGSLKRPDQKLLAI